MLIRITIRSNIIAGAIFKILSRSFYAEILALQGLQAGLRDSYFIRDKSGYPEFRNNQTFSIAGSRKGFGDPRGTLFFELARLAEARKPDYLLFENVPYVQKCIRYILYNQLLMSEKLYPHLLEIARTAQERVETMLPHMMETAGVTEELKACDPMRWVGLMNTLTAQIEEILIRELICS